MSLIIQEFKDKMHFNHHNIVSMKAYTIIVVFDKIIHLIEFTPPKPNQLIANTTCYGPK